MGSQVFEIPDMGGGGLLILLLLVPAALLAVLTVVFWPRPLSVEVTPQELRIRGTVYGRTIPRSALDISDARTVDLSREPALIPVRRSNGVGLNNYQVGWFRLRNGQRALCFLTRTESVLYLPTHRGFVLLVSASEPQLLLAALEK